MLKYIITAFDLKLALLQYFRFKRQWVCVDEFHGADIVADTGTEIIEVEVKITKNDLINGEKKKARKHQAYKAGGQFYCFQPNKFLFCVPEKLVNTALEWANEINKKYGIIGFDVETFENRIDKEFTPWHCAYIRIAKSAQVIHEKYNSKLRWAIAKRASSKIASLTELHFKRTLERIRGQGCQIKGEMNERRNNSSTKDVLCFCKR